MLEQMSGTYTVYISPQISVIWKSILAKLTKFKGNTEAYYPTSNFALRDSAERDERKTLPC